MDIDLWIDVSLESKEKEAEIELAINTCYVVHIWTVEQMKAVWTEELRLLTAKEMEPAMLRYVEKVGHEGRAQRFTLVAAMQKAITQFQKELRTASSTEEDGGRMVVTLPPSVPKGRYTEMDIQSRIIWRRYLEDYGRLSTKYGLVFLEGNWPDIMRAYAERMEVGLEWLPLLWHSITLREEIDGWKIRFNFYDPNSAQGKRRTKGKRRLHAKAMA